MRFLLPAFLLLAALCPLRASDADEASEDGRSSSGSASSRQSSAPVRDYWLNRTLSAILWNPAPGVPLSRIEIRLGQAKLYGYQGDRLVAMTSVSTGKDGHETPPGDYKVIDKDKDHKSTEYGSFVDASGKTVEGGAKAGDPAPAGAHYEAAPMQWYLRLTDDGVGLHAGFVTGYPVSHGCIRLPPTFAADLFSVVSIGTPVSVRP